MRTLRFLLRKELLQIRRDRAMLRLLTVLPIIQLLFLSSAATFEIRRTATYIVDLDQSATSRGLVQRMVASGRFEARESSPSMSLAGDAMLRHDASVIVRIPAGFERDLVRSGRAPVHLVFDAQDGAAAGVLQSYALRIIAAYGDELEREGRVPSGPGAATGPIELRTRGWYNAGLDYQAYMVPGLLALIVTVVGTAIASMNIVREKELGTLEQLNVTPVTKAQFIASKLLPFWAIALVDLAIGLAVGALVFDIPVRGSLALTFAAAAIYLVVALAIGLWISTVARTQQQAMFLSFAVTMVYMLMSGLFTPLQSMPGWAQWLAQLSPVKHFVVILRAVLVKGAGVAEVYQPLLVVAGYGAVILAVAVRQYRKTTP
jgi:ABC-2 type transport system permease protein